MEGIIPNGYKLPLGFTMPPKWGYNEELKYNFSIRDNLPQKLKGKAEAIARERGADLQRQGKYDEFDRLVEDVYAEVYKDWFFGLSKYDRDVIVKTLLRNIQIVQKTHLLPSEKTLLDKFDISESCRSTWIETYEPNFEYYRVKANYIKCGQLLNCSTINENKKVCDKSPGYINQYEDPTPSPYNFWNKYKITIIITLISILLLIIFFSIKGKGNGNVNGNVNVNVNPVNDIVTSFGNLF